MSKQIRVSDAAYAVIEREAKRNHRSVIADQVDAMVLPLKSFDQTVGTTHAAETMKHMTTEQAKPFKPRETWQAEFEGDE